MRRTHAAIKELILKMALDPRMARGILRKSGFRPGGRGGPGGAFGPTAVLSFDVAQTYVPLYSEDTGATVWLGQGIWTYFNWGIPVFEHRDWWPDGLGLPNDARWVTAVDLTRAEVIRNTWYVPPRFANPNVNIRIEASLDGLAWEYPSDDWTGDWTLEGCNANLGQWLTYNDAGEPYRTYVAYHYNRMGQDDVIPGGITESGWYALKPKFQTETVFLRWTMDNSYQYDPDPYYLNFLHVAVAYGEIQVA